MAGSRLQQHGLYATLENILGQLHVRPHDLHFLVIELPRLLQNGQRNADFAHIVHKRARVHASSRALVADQAQRQLIGNPCRGHRMGCLLYTSFRPAIFICVKPAEHNSEILLLEMKRFSERRLSMQDAVSK